MSGIWTGADFALGEGTNLISTVSYAVSAPSIHLYQVNAIYWTWSVRCQLNSAGTPVPYWWCSAEVATEVLFADDGVDIMPDLDPSDERVMHYGQLTPRISYHPTAGSAALVWASEPTENRVVTRRNAKIVGSVAPAVYFHLTASDQHGVFATGANLNNRAFAVNLSARVHWNILP